MSQLHHLQDIFSKHMVILVVGIKEKNIVLKESDYINYDLNCSTNKQFNEDVNWQLIQLFSLDTV